MNSKHIKKITLVKNNRIIETFDNAYFIKPKRKFKNEDIYEMLEDRGFHHFLKPIERLEQEEIFLYFPEKHYQIEEKAIDMIHVLSLLQNKTTFYQEIILDEVKEFYEAKSKELTDLFCYYENLETCFLKEVYPSSSIYLFQRNLSLIFSSLSYAKERLEKWYQAVTLKKHIRKVLVHHCFELSHFLDGKTPYLLSLSQMDYGSPVTDLVYFIQTHCLELDISSLYSIYQKTYPFTKEEQLLFSFLLALPPKLEVLSTYQGTVLLSRNLNKLKKCFLFLLEEDKRCQKQEEK